MDVQCWNCGQKLSIEKISFRSLCEACGEYLHCCQNCIFFQEGLPNDCKIPGTDYVSDRRKGNFCEEFSSIGHPIEKKQKETKKFEDLFR